MWARHCEFCGNRLDIDFQRCLKIKKISVLHFKDGRYQLEYKNNNTEGVVCEKCAKEHSIKDLWEKIQYHSSHLEEQEDSKDET